MRHRFEDSCNINILNWKLYRKINFIRSWSSRKVQFLSETSSFLPLKIEHAIIYFQFREFYVPFMTLQSIGFKFFAKVIKGSCVFCCSSCISFNPTSHLNKLLSELIYAERDSLSVTAYTDNQSLHNNLHSTKQTLQKRLIVDTSSLHEMVNRNEAQICRQERINR